MNTIELADPLDKTSAILYIVFNTILAFGPMTLFFAYVKPILDTWTTKANGFYKFAYYWLWIANLVIYGIPAVVGGFTWFWNAYVNAGYIAWNQYLVLWGGTALQGLNFLFMLIAAFTYTDVTDIGARNFHDEFVEIMIWSVVTAGIYSGYWLLNNNFITYYVVEEINHEILSEEVIAIVEETSLDF